MREMNKCSNSLWPIKLLLVLFVLVLIAYGVLAVVYGLEQNTFRMPAIPALPRASGFF